MVSRGGNAAAQVFYKVLMGFRPGIPTNMEKGYKEVMEACWQPTDAARPTFEVILKCLQVRGSCLLSAQQS